MKVAELREKLSKLKKDDIIKLSVEFYKLVPKSKKEDYDLDALINNPKKNKKPKKSKSHLDLETIEEDVKEFIVNAKEQYYLVPNRVVPKKERSTWRFKVKKWYKELININREDADLKNQSQILLELYELICESCGSTYFSAYDSFQSIGVEQTDFYTSTIKLIQEAEGKGNSVEKGILLIINNYLSRNALYSFLMKELIKTLDIPDLKEKGIEVVKRLLVENGYKPNSNEKKRSRSFSNGEYEKRKNNNNLAELGFRLYYSLFELDEGINFYESNYYNDDDEIKLYVLIRLLFEKKEKNQIKKEIEKRIEKGTQPRDGLLKLLKEIKENDKLPNYI